MRRHTSFTATQPEFFTEREGSGEKPRPEGRCEAEAERGEV